MIEVNNNTDKLSNLQLDTDIEKTEIERNYSAAIYEDRLKNKCCCCKEW